jgi:alpha-L-fucosidase
MDRLTDFSWLTDDTISRGSWCYTENLTIKPTSIVLHSLIDIVSKNGVLLLNISPMADGTIPQNQKDVLLSIGAWLGKYGEAIYDTRPWHTYGEGPTRLIGGRFGGVTDAAGYTPEDIRYTTKGKTIYAIALGSPQTGAKIAMTSFAATKLADAVKVSRVTVVGSNEPLEFEQSEEGLTVSMPNRRMDDLAVVLKIEQ